MALLLLGTAATCGSRARTAGLELDLMRLMSSI